MRGFALSLFVALALGLAPGAVAQTATCTTEWADPVDGDWNDASRWSGGAVPGPADDACVTVAGTYTVTNNTAPQIRVNALTLGGSSGTQTLDTDEGIALSAPSTIRANGRWEWRIGALSGGATLTNAGVIQIDGFFNGVQRSISGLGTKLINQGTVDWLDDQLHLIDDGAFTNDGLLTKTAGGVNVAQLTVSGTDTGSRLFTNTGTIDVQAGRIYIDARSVTDGASLAVASGATLEFGGGGTVTHTFAGTTSGTIAGVLRMTRDAQFDAQAGAVWAFGGTGIEWVQADLIGGEALTNAGSITITDFFNGIERSIAGVGTALLNTGTIDWIDDSLYLLDGGALTNTGTLVKTAAGVRAANLFVQSTDLNPGTFSNTGLIDVQAGSMNLDAPSRTDGATLTVASGAVLEFGGGGAVTHTFAGTTSGTSGGILRMTGDAQFAPETGAVWDFGGAGIEWVEADLTGGETLTNAGLVTITGFFNGIQRSISGAGTVFANTGTLDWIDDSLFLLEGGALVNAGTLLKTAAGVRAANLFVAATDPGSFTNTGTIDVRAGQMNLDAPSLTTSATLAVATGSTLEFGGGTDVTHTFAGTTVGTPEGVLRMAGDAQFAAQSGATWAVGGTGVEWTVADLVGGQTLTNSGLLRIESFFNGVRRSISGIGTALVNTGTVEWNSDDLALMDDGALVNAGLFVRTPGGVSGTRLLGTGTDTGARTFTNSGTVEVRSGTLNLDVPVSHAAGGRITGFTTFDIAGATFTHAGDTSPGSADSTGVLLWTGQPWAPPSGASLFARIGGTTAGDDYDQLRVLGTATLAGTLALSLAEGATPTVGDSYTVLTATAVSGAFDAVEAPPGYGFEVAVGTTDVVVTVTAVGVVAELTGAEGWRMLAPSVTGQTLDGVVGSVWTQGFPGADVETGGSNVFLYDEPVPGDEALGYVVPGSQSDAFALGTGAFVYIFADDDQGGPQLPGFPKTLVQSGADVVGAVSIPVSYTDSGSADDDGWTLAGNPYAAGLDWTDAAWTRTAVSNTVYVWDPSSADYLTHNGAMGSLPSGAVPAGQGMWVQAMGAGADLVAPATARIASPPLTGREAAHEFVELRLSPADPGARIRASAFVGRADAASEARDALDGFELAPLAETALGLWTARRSDGVALDLQMLPALDGVRLDVGVASWQEGEPAATPLVLSWPTLPGEMPARLHDRTTGALVDLRVATSYAFTAAPGGAHLGAPGEALRQAPGGERFELRLGAAAVADGGIPAAVETQLGVPRPNPSRGAARLAYTLAEGGPVRLSVFDMVGREVHVLVDAQRAAGEHTAELRVAGLAAGVYVARLQAPDGTVSTRRLTVVR